MKRLVSESDPDLDPFRFGWRYVPQVGADGRKRWVQLPLSLDDVLHPQEGDHIPENTQQERDRRYLACVLEMRLAKRPRTLVLSDCLIRWGVPGLGDHSPDVSVFDGVEDVKRGRGSFSVVKERARALLAVEVVSPDKHDKQARDNDVVTKVDEYYRAGVPLYLVVDQEREGGPRRLLGYRRGRRGYVRMRGDAQGRLRLSSLGLLVGLREGRVVCWDTETGEEIGDLLTTTEQRDAEAQARREAEAALFAAQARIRDLESQTRRKPSKKHSR